MEKEAKGDKVTKGHIIYLSIDLFRHTWKVIGTKAGPDLSLSLEIFEFPSSVLLLCPCNAL